MTNTHREMHTRSSAAAAALTGLALLSGCATFTARQTPTLCLATDGRAQAQIILPRDASEQLQEAARQLSRYLKRSTAAEFPVVAEPAAKRGDSIRIHVGPTARAAAARLGLDALDADGFVIAFPDPHTVLICGPTDWGTEFGVYEFLERVVGVRWLFPGALGEHVPQHRELTAVALDVREEPAFFSRQMSGLAADHRLWARRNRMHGRVKFHHNLIRLFPPETYTKTQPQFFPVHGGKRFLPPSNTTHGWQPCYSAPGLVEEAVRNIARTFDRNPDAPSYSLGANDSSGYCQCDECLAQITGEQNFLGRVDYSDLYYDWANQVIDGVLKTHPDKLFGCLAYSEVAAPPDRVTVHPRLIPYMTYDRMKWADRRIAREGRRMTRDWAKASPTLGWYDYIYGKFYCVPRVWFHTMAKYYRFGYRHHVRCSYAEAYPSKDWREGPKLYVSLKLLWDPNRDVDTLLDDWCRAAVGPGAASVLVEYFSFWEAFWEGPALRTEWFEEARQRQYLKFKETGYLEALSIADLERCEALLSMVLDRAHTTPQKQRARKFLNDFREWSKPLPAEIERLKMEKATRTVALAQQARLAALMPLRGVALAEAVAGYREWLAGTPQSPYTGMITLTLGALEERAGSSGAWAAAFNNTPWAATATPWVKPFVATLDAQALLDKQTLTAGRAVKAPVIDGVLDEAFWRDADKAGQFTEFRKNLMVTQPTFVAAAYDAENLYLAYLCLEQTPEHLSADTGKHDGPVWRDDCIEFFVTPELRVSDYYQFIVNPGGTTYDAIGFRKDKWNPKTKVGIVKGDRFWTVEAALPLAAFAAPKPGLGSEWRINLTRARKHFGQTTISAWRFAEGKNNDIAKFGRLRFE